MGWDIRASLKEYRRRWETTAGEEVERLLNGDPPLPCKAWRRMWRWYIRAVDHAPPPAQITLERITAERKEIYCAVPPLGGTIPTSVSLSSIDDSVPTEYEVIGRYRDYRGTGP